MYSKKGEILKASALVKTEDVSVTIIAISPISGLNPIGMDTLVITGTDLPTNILDSVVEVEFLKSSVSRGTCMVVDSTATQITCITNEFTDPRGSDVGSTFDL